MRNLRIPIKIATKNTPVHRIKDLAKYHKFKMMAISQNRSHLFDTRPLKRSAHNKLRNHLGPLPWKALEAIVAGETVPKGTKLSHLEPIIRFLLTELGWREGQPSHEDDKLEDMSISVSQLMSTQNAPTEDLSSAKNATKDCQDNLTESQMEFLKTQNRPDDNSGAKSVPEQPVTDQNGNNSLTLTQMIEELESSGLEEKKDELVDEKKSEDHSVATNVTRNSQKCKV